MKHPRAPELTKLVDALEKSGRPVSAVVVRWRDDMPEWEIRFGANGARPEEPVKWSD